MSEAEPGVAPRPETAEMQPVETRNVEAETPQSAHPPSPRERVIPVKPSLRAAPRRQSRESHRRRLTRRLRELHVRLRTEGDTPARRAVAVGVGTMVGCTPLYGVHLFLCTILARLFHLSRVYTYMAANINNPITLPFLLFVEMKIGYRVMEGRWPALSLAELRAAGVLGLGRNVLVGSVVLGLLLGTIAGLLTWLLARGRKADPFNILREAAAEPYLKAGVMHWEFVRGKLRHDPMYRGLLETGLLPRRGRLVDLGCGRGILIALLVAVADAAEGDDAMPPMELIGIERHGAHARAAHKALSQLPHQAPIDIQRGDLRHLPVPRCETAVLLDVLHYMPREAQVDLLTRVAEALTPGGLLLLREADADAGWRFATTRSAERLMAVLRGRFLQRFCFRGRAGWEELVRATGLEVDSRPMSEGTPYGNVLLVARKPGAAQESVDSDAAVPHAAAPTVTPTFPPEEHSA